MKITIYVIVVLILIAGGLWLFKNNTKSNNPMLKHNPAEYYSGDALMAAEAIRNGKHTVLSEIVKNSPDVASSRGNKDFPILAWAMGHNDPKAVKILLEAGAEPNTYVNVGDAKMSLLGIAVGAEKPDFFNLLLEHKANPNGIPGTELPLVTAEYADQEERFEQLLKAGADLNHADSVGKTIVMVMALARKYEKALELVKLGANPNVSLTNGTTIRKIIEKYPLPENTPEGKAQKELLGMLAP